MNGTLNVLRVIIMVMIGFFVMGCSNPNNNSNNDDLSPAVLESDNAGTLLFIESGKCIMGSPETELERKDNENQHWVTLSSFYMGKHEVTQKQYQSVMGTNPSFFQGERLPAAGETQDNRPIEQVTWYDAVIFCNTLSQKEGLAPVYSLDGKTNPSEWGMVNETGKTLECNWNANGYRLPTEAEWEYACRSGTTAAYYTEEDTMSDAIGWYDGNYKNGFAEGDSGTHEAGKKLANNWGLQDMYGNVHEWCWDWLGEYRYLDLEDPRGAPSGSRRVRRGGGYDDYAPYLRSAYRGSLEPNAYNRLTGFRLVRSL